LHARLCCERGPSPASRATSTNCTGDSGVAACVD
jgi:hypothetical protein